MKQLEDDNNCVMELIAEIIKNKLEINLSSISGDSYNHSLLDRNINFKARHLLMLYIEIEKAFHISIPEEEVLAGNFNTINNIARIVISQRGVIAN